MYTRSLLYQREGDTSQSLSDRAAEIIAGFDSQQELLPIKMKGIVMWGNQVCELKKPTICYSAAKRIG